MHFIFGWLQSVWNKIWKLLYAAFWDVETSIKPPVVEINTEMRPNKIIAGYFWTGSCRILRPFEHLNPGLLTHIYYAFLELEEDGTLSIQNAKRSIKLRYPEDLSNFRKQNPHLKVLFSVVGKKDSFSTVVADDMKRKLFIESALVLIIKWEFNGLDLDWEFPKETDKENFVKLLCELSTAFQKHGFLLSAAVRAIPVYDGSGYDVPEMVKYLDIINIMTYDFYGAWSSHTGPNSPLYPSSIDSSYERKYLNVEASLKNWLEAGASKEKICLGIPFYGRTFKLKDKDQHGLHAPVSGAGKPVALTYIQILLNCNEWVTVWNDEQKTPYKYHENQWVGYDDQKSVTEKVQFALDQDVGGVFVWQLGGDDVTGESSGGIRQVLLTTIYQKMVGAPPAQPILGYGSELDPEDSDYLLEPGSEQDAEASEPPLNQFVAKALERIAAKTTEQQPNEDSELQEIF